MSTNNALVVGTGFAGLYALYRLKERGFDVKAIESAPDVGGTWYWNRYPGARSDVNVHAYQFSFDKELLKNFPWPNNYFLQPELQAYFQEVARKHELYPLIRFNNELKSAEWDENNKNWKVKVGTRGNAGSEEFTVRYLVTAIGILHEPHIPDFKGLDKFKGKIVHSSQWSPEIRHEGKKIGVFGNGASGVQLASSLAEKAGTLTHFIRHAQYVLPAQYQTISTEERQNLNERIDAIWDEIYNSAVGFGFPEPARATLSVSAEEREKIFQELWDLGSGFRFMFGGFNDIGGDEKANKEAINFIHKKIKGIVKDPQKAEVLTSSDWFARRPLTDDKYYERFNQDNVFAVNIKENPINEVTEAGIKLEDGTEYPLDLIVFATGFDAVDGSYHRIDFKGVNGRTLKDHWKNGPETHTGVTTAGFPNLFFVNGPGVPFSNQVPTVEIAADFVADLIGRGEDIRARGHGTGVVESTPEADTKWMDACKQVAQQTLFSKTNSWFFGENIPGKAKSPLFWFGGIAEWRKAIGNVKANGYEGFDFGLPGPHSNSASLGVRTSHTAT